jgi:uncharacterized membrane protein YeiH
LGGARSVDKPVGGFIILDAGGLSLFAVSGTSKSPLYGLTPVSAVLVGAAVMTVGLCRGRPRGQMMLIGGASCLILRLIAVWQHWGLPHADAL